MRGEQLNLLRCSASAAGSPPLARGTELSNRSYIETVRITPACAGNSDKARGKSPEGRDHPRLRGEQIAIVIELFKQLGSPPLARGTVNIFAMRYGVAGITPACAGNSCGELCRSGRGGDHPRLRREQSLPPYNGKIGIGSPRLRGEQLGLCFAYSLLLGSPPLARGTVKRLLYPHG